ncbi:MAG: VWA domain-containing protein [Gemmataceae bacterium]|nr:VWA domain-containing protein [Gemmataceae bacterium]
MPHFTQPLWLQLLALIPPLLWWWDQQSRSALRFSDTRPLLRLPSGRSGQARYGGLILRGAGLMLLVVALAGPRWPDPGSRIATDGIAIVLVVDVSGSMNERDFTWQGEPVRRIDAVKRALRLFVEGGEGPEKIKLEGRRNDLLGLVTFATVPESVCPLTLSHPVLLALLENEQPRERPDEGRTNIGDGIAWGLHRLRAAGPRRKVLVLLTDGEHNVGPPALKPRQAGQLAGNLGVPIYTIDAGNDAPPKAPADGADGTSAADRLKARKILQEVARMTRGRYFQAHDTKALLDVCSQIDRLERSEIESFRYRRYAEGYAWFGLGSFVLFVLAQALELTWWRRVP